MRWMMKVAVGSLGMTLACNSSEAPPAPSLAASAPAAPAVPPPAASQKVIAGTVAERLDASSYTYLRLLSAVGEEWVAVPKTGAPVGARVEVVDAILMQGFESRTLNRRFERIHFGNLAKGDGALPAGHPPVERPVETAAAVERVAKAEGDAARTVAEVWAQKQSLAGKQVAVRGTVVKYTADVLGKNWLHLQDGSGTRQAGDHDLTVTSTATAALGEVVTIEGEVGLEKDFGAGYTYPVIVEDAAIRR